MIKNKTLWRIHNWTGLYVGIVIGILSITGAVAIFIPEIEDFLDRSYQLPSSQSGEKASFVFKTVEEGSLPEEFSKFSLLGIYPGQTPEDPWVYDYYYSGEKYESERYKVFVDPSTGDYLGRKDQLNSVPNYLRQVHVRLMDGWYGRQLVGLAGIGLLVISITGLLIYGNFMKSQVFGAIRNQKGIRVIMADWHKLIGIAALLFNLMIAITGGWLGLQPKLMTWTDMKVPNHYQRSEKPLEASQDEALNFDLNALMGKLNTEFPDFKPVMIIPSSNGYNTIEMRGDYVGTLYEPHIHKIVLDKTDLQTLFAYDGRKQNFWHKLYFIQEGLHFGRYAGLITKILYFILGLTSGFLSLTGFIIYLKRKEAKTVFKSTVMKTVFVYSVSILVFLILMGWAVTFFGYVWVATVITPSVYIFLIGFIVYHLFRWRKRRRSIINEKIQKNKSKITARQL